MYFDGMHILVTISADGIRLGADIPGSVQIELLTMRPVIVLGLLGKSILRFSRRLSIQNSITTRKCSHILKCQTIMSFFLLILMYEKKF